MPAVRAKGRSKKAVNKAVGANIRELSKNKKGRSRKQIIAIAESEAKGGRRGKR